MSKNFIVTSEKTLMIALCVSVFFLNPVFSQDSRYGGKKVLYVNSYHEGYYWSDGEQQGAEAVLRPAGVELKIVYMDTKNNPSDEFSKKAGRRVHEIIEEFKPDVVIVADDNAYKDVLEAFYRDKELPFVFCGLNWDISQYPVSYKNTTGMLEVALVGPVYKHLFKFAKGPTIAFLSYDSLNERNNIQYYKTYLKDVLIAAEFVSDFRSWKESFLQLQNKADMIYLTAPDGIKDWNMQDAQSFILENAKRPIGVTASPAMIPLSLLGVMKVPEEQGEHAARCALRILDGQAPDTIPVISNKKGYLYLNLKVAHRLGVVFTPIMVRNAKEIFGEQE